jgi:hypothetical protein
MGKEMANCEYMGGMLMIREKTFDLMYTVDLYPHHLTAQIAGAYKLPRLSS